MTSIPQGETFTLWTSQTMLSFASSTIAGSTTDSSLTNAQLGTGFGEASDPVLLGLHRSTQKEKVCQQPFSN